MTESKTIDTNRVKRILIVSAMIAMMFVTLGYVLTNDPHFQDLFENDPNPKFVISQWSYPDQYGQGMEWFYLYEKTYGGAGYELKYFINYYNDTSQISWNSSTGMKLKVACWLNSTLTGSSGLNDGKNHLRHNITVRNGYGIVVWNQDNFTYEDGDDTINPPLWRYVYYVEIPEDTLSHTGITGMYTITVTYEVWYRL